MAMEDLEVFDWCVQNIGRKVQPLDVRYAVETDNTDAVSNLNSSYEFDTGLILSFAAKYGSIQSFKWCFKHYTPYSLDTAQISQIIYEVVKNGHCHILQWLESTGDIDKTYFPDDRGYVSFTRISNSSLTNTAIKVREIYEII